MFLHPDVIIFSFFDFSKKTKTQNQNYEIWKFVDLRLVFCFFRSKNYYIWRKPKTLIGERRGRAGEGARGPDRRAVMQGNNRRGIIEQKCGGVAKTTSESSFEVGTPHYSKCKKKDNFFWSGPGVSWDVQNCRQCFLDVRVVIPNTAWHAETIHVTPGIARDTRSWIGVLRARLLG